MFGYRSDGSDAICGAGSVDHHRVAVLPRIVGGSGDAGVGADACRIEMYLYTLYILGYDMGEDGANSNCWRGGRHEVAYDYNYSANNTLSQPAELGSAAREDRGSGYGDAGPGMRTRVSKHACL